MMDDPVVRMARAVATRDYLNETINRPEITLPKKKIKHPVEWTVMETAGAAINGSFVRYNAGDKLDDPLSVKLLRAEGVKIEATA
jgi:hypothetical protein